MSDDIVDFRERLAKIFKKIRGAANLMTVQLAMIDSEISQLATESVTSPDKVVAIVEIVEAMLQKATGNVFGMGLQLLAHTECATLLHAKTEEFRKAKSEIAASKNFLISRFEEMPPEYCGLNCGILLIFTSAESQFFSRLKRNLDEACNVMINKAIKRQSWDEVERFLWGLANTADTYNSPWGYTAREIITEQYLRISNSAYLKGREYKGFEFDCRMYEGYGNKTFLSEEAEKNILNRLDVIAKAGLVATAYNASCQIMRAISTKSQLHEALNNRKKALLKHIKTLKPKRPEVETVNGSASYIPRNSEGATIH